MGVNDQLHASAVIPMGKEPLIPIGYDVSVYSAEEKNLFLYHFYILGFSSPNLVTVVIELHCIICLILMP
jgi:hypothetical protein